MQKNVIENNGNEIIWTIHPVKKNWKVSIAVILFLLSLCVAIYISFNSLAFLFLSIVILFVSLMPFFFPTTYSINEDCVVIKSVYRRLSRNWNTFKSFYPDKNGVLLSPFVSPSRLENFRGVYLRFGNNKPEILDFVAKKLK